MYHSFSVLDTVKTSWYLIRKNFAVLSLYTLAGYFIIALIGILIYFLSGNEIAKCSVLFLNTNRQVVFIWSDEENRCSISSLLFGGQLNLKSSMETGKYVAENNWMLKSGVRPGMSLLQLRILNENDFVLIRKREIISLD